jgi:hypothetical protein
MHCLAGTSSYTAEQFAADVIAILPLALPELQKLGVMKICACCGKPFNDGTLVVRGGRDQSQSIEVSILALCKADRDTLTKISPNHWAHVSEASGLFPTEREWAPLIQALHYCAMVTLHKVHGGLTLAAITSAPAVQVDGGREEP